MYIISMCIYIYYEIYVICNMHMYNIYIYVLLVLSLYTYMYLYIYVNMYFSLDSFAVSVPCPVSTGVWSDQLRNRWPDRACGPDLVDPKPGADLVDPKPGALANS